MIHAKDDTGPGNRVGRRSPGFCSCATIKERSTIFLISKDEEDSALKKYVEELKQPWPFLKISKTPKFDKQFKSGIDSIPAIVICDPKVRAFGSVRAYFTNVRNSARSPLGSSAVPACAHWSTR